MSLLKLSLHLTPSGACVGGGWAFYHPSDTLVASEALPEFSEPLTPEDASRFLTSGFLARHGHQLAF